jgi:PIN domain nuclease of toxin-antitoxin system
MSLLLDTHTLLWLLTNDPKLSARARGAIENAANEAHISAASLWEVVIKSALGKHPTRTSFLASLKRIALVCYPSPRPIAPPCSRCRFITATRSTACCSPKPRPKA